MVKYKASLLGLNSYKKSNVATDVLITYNNGKFTLDTDQMIEILSYLDVKFLTVIDGGEAKQMQQKPKPNDADNTEPQFYSCHELPDKPGSKRPSRGLNIADLLPASFKAKHPYFQNKE